MFKSSGLPIWKQRKRRVGSSQSFISMDKQQRRGDHPEKLQLMAY